MLGDSIIRISEMVDSSDAHCVMQSGRLLSLCSTQCYRGAEIDGVNTGQVRRGWRQQYCRHRHTLRARSLVDTWPTDRASGLYLQGERITYEFITGCRPCIVKLILNIYLEKKILRLCIVSNQMVRSLP